MTEHRKRLIKIWRSVFHCSRSILSHKANGEICPICNTPMKTRQGIVNTAAYGRLHSVCWPEALVKYFKEEFERNPIDPKAS